MNGSISRAWRIAIHVEVSFSRYFIHEALPEAVKRVAGAFGVNVWFIPCLVVNSGVSTNMWCSSSDLIWQAV
jgi:hypothetical protein